MLRVLQPWLLLMSRGIFLLPCFSSSQPCRKVFATDDDDDDEREGLRLIDGGRGRGRVMEDDEDE